MVRKVTIVVIVTVVSATMSKLWCWVVARAIVVLVDLLCRCWR